MAINITQFAPPSRVSSLVWDKNMEPPAGKVFEGDLVGNVTGNVTGNVVGNITNGGVNGYLLRSGVVSASSGTLIVPAGSSEGNNPVTINLNGNGTYCIVGNTQKCFYPNPCTIPVALTNLITGHAVDSGTSYAKSYDSDGVLIDEVIFSHLITSGSLNIYDASYIVINGGFDSDANVLDVSIANAYIDADTTITPGMVPPPTTGVFTGDVVGNVTGNVTGDVITTYRMTPRTPYNYTHFVSGNTSDINGVYMARDNIALYNVMPNQLLTGSINAYYSGGKSAQLRYLDKGWYTLDTHTLTSVAADYTIPAGTNCILLILRGDYQSSADAAIARFNIAVV